MEPERREEFLRTSDARRMAWAWRRYTKTGLAQGPALGAERYHELRYEDLVRQPVDEGERILDFLDIERQRSRDAFLGGPARRRFLGGHLAQHLLPVGAGRDRRRGRRPAATARLTTTDPTLDHDLTDAGRAAQPRLPAPGPPRERRPPLRPAHRRRGRGPSGLTINEAEAGRVDERSEQLAEVAAGLSGCEVVVMQWNRRGWGKHGRSLPG